jgi:hypothetical protein
MLSSNPNAIIYPPIHDWKVNHKVSFINVYVFVVLLLATLSQSQFAPTQYLFASEIYTRDRIDKEREEEEEAHSARMNLSPEGLPHGRIKTLNVLFYKNLFSVLHIEWIGSVKDRVGQINFPKKCNVIFLSTASVCR